MYSHIFVSVTDFDRALAFHAAVMQALGLELRFCERDKPWAGWQSPGRRRPYFVIGRPYDGGPHGPGNGQMVAFDAASREIVREVHRVVLAHGGRCDGPPGLRGHYHPDYYGAYYRDLDGNKFGVACHVHESERPSAVGRVHT